MPTDPMRDAPPYTYPSKEALARRPYAPHQPRGHMKRFQLTLRPAGPEPKIIEAAHLAVRDGRLELSNAEGEVVFVSAPGEWRYAEEVKAE